MYKKGFGIKYLQWLIRHKLQQSEILFIYYAYMWKDTTLQFGPVTRIKQ